MEISIYPIAKVKNNRKDIVDDYWGSIISIIELEDGINESSLDGIQEFSHLEVIFYFDKVKENSIEFDSRHPRNNKEYPKIGIFSQRGKNRPNRLGVTIVELLEVNKNKLFVKGLDAIDGTPIIDIKPVMKEFLPKGEVFQPNWSISLMKNYWS